MYLIMSYSLIFNAKVLFLLSQLYLKAITDEATIT